MPFWVDLDPKARNGDSQLVEIEKQARWIKRAFELALQPDMGDNKIADSYTRKASAAVTP